MLSGYSYEYYPVFLTRIWCSANFVRFCWGLGPQYLPTKAASALSAEVHFVFLNPMIVIFRRHGIILLTMMQGCGIMNIRLQ